MNKKIGIFDSGIGGLSILGELIKILPNENYLFYEDSINNPYGEKTDEELFLITSNVVDYLLENDCKIIVIACNTATTSCMKKLREKYKDVIFVGTVPAIKVAYDNNLKHTLLLATPYTVNSKRVKELLKDYTAGDQEISVVSGENLASLIEVGNEKEIKKILKKILLPYKEKIDSIILGCTHYPLVKDIIKEIIPNIEILDGSLGVAQEVKHQLTENNLLNHSRKKGNVVIENSKSKELIKRSYDILSKNHSKIKSIKNKNTNLEEKYYFINSRVGVLSLFLPLLFMIDFLNKKDFLMYVELVYFITFLINMILFFLTLRIGFKSKTEIVLRNALAVSLIVSYFNLVMMGIFSLALFNFNMIIFSLIMIVSIIYCILGVYLINKKINKN